MEVIALPIKSIVECAFFLAFRKDGLEVPLEGFGLSDDVPAATAHAKRRAMIAALLVRAIGMVFGRKTC